VAAAAAAAAADADAVGDKITDCSLLFHLAAVHDRQQTTAAIHRVQSSKLRNN